MDLRRLLGTCLGNAQSKTSTAASTQDLHRQRSIQWVESVAAGFRQQFSNESDIRVFSKYCHSNRGDFTLNELLYDVCVCRVGTATSAVHQRPLYYIREALWQVESEVARDSRQALVDFNKLVLGSAANKLFIGPQVHDPESLLGVLSPAAACCTGNVFAALVLHPDAWDSTPPSVRVYRFAQGGWLSMD